LGPCRSYEICQWHHADCASTALIASDVLAAGVEYAHSHTCVCLHRAHTCGFLHSVLNERSILTCVAALLRASAALITYIQASDAPAAAHLLGEARGNRVQVHAAATTCHIVLSLSLYLSHSRAAGPVRRLQQVCTQMCEQKLGAASCIQQDVQAIRRSRLVCFVYPPSPLSLSLSLSLSFSLTPGAGPIFCIENSAGKL